MRYEDSNVEIEDTASPHKTSRKKKDHDDPEVSFLELLKLNKPDWYLVLVGVIGSAITGCLFPLMSVIFGSVLRVSPSPFRSPRILYFHFNYNDFIQ